MSGGMILAIESSCDESAAAVFDPARGVTGDWVYSQIALHGRHGGVVPDLAAREHIRQLPPLIAQAREIAGRSVDRIAVTHGPGLAPCLALGVAAAKAAGLALGVPVVGVNHLRGHVWSPFLPLHGEAPGQFAERAQTWFPHLALIVSGGHTLLAGVSADRTVRVLASTRDDAAGEALDKGAKLLGLGYPGGPWIEQEARLGDARAFDFPRGLDRKDEVDFSFSGLKTSLRYAIERMGADQARARRADLCASYQAAVVDALAKKTRIALSQGAFRSLGLSGGVARNASLRERLAVEAHRAGAVFLPVGPDQAGDNAAIIAFAAWMDPAGTSPAGLDLAISPSLAL
jgi:N6-L-threonylcarbamoyladenine synthase